jgi:hypothetical protein
VACLYSMLYFFMSFARVGQPHVIFLLVNNRLYTS